MTEEQEKSQRFERWWNTMGADRAMRIRALFPLDESEVTIKSSIRDIWNSGYDWGMELMVNR